MMTSFIYILAAWAIALATTSHAFPIAPKCGDKRAPAATPPPYPDDRPPLDRSRWSGGFNPFYRPPRAGGGGRGSVWFFKTCDEAPQVCRAWGSPGPDCCGRLCVNLAVDFFNCGQCGRRCRFGEMCCGGQCVNVFFDRNNCGFCGNRCKEGGFCRYGMCDYAL